MSESEFTETVPSAEIRFLTGQHSCRNTGSCRDMVSRNCSRLAGRYIGDGEVNEKEQVIAAIIDIGNLSYEGYIATIKKYSKGAALRQSKKAVKAGCYCHPFPRQLHVPDIVEINKSKTIRSGGKMKAAYLKSVEEMGGYPGKHQEYRGPDCPVHYDIWWGIFESIPGYMQGTVQTDEKLLGYIDLRRIGNYAIYSLIIGHGDYLGKGIMYELHLNVMKWLLEPDNICSKGLEYLMYAGYKQGGDGLKQWKKKFDFKPAYLWTDEVAHSLNPGFLQKSIPGLSRLMKKFRKTLGLFA